MKKLFYIFIILLSTGFSSCKDYLNETPKNTLVNETAISDFSKAKAAVGGVYSTFQNDNWAGALYIAQTTKAGFMGGSGTLDYDLSYTQASGGNVGIWTAFYRSLNAANFAVNGITNLSSSAVPSETDREALIGEARCLRAWINANILWNFAHWWAADDDPYGILYRDQVVDMSNVQQKRLSVGESYKKIYEDLDYAIAKMNDFTSPRYLSKQFAKVLKAKLLLYRGGYNNTTADLQSALTLVNDVIATLPAACSMERNLADVYTKSWDSQENLFVRYLEDNGSRTSAGGYYYTYGIIYSGNALPLAAGGSLTAGLRYGVDWFSADPRWSIATGPVRAPETWDNTYRYAFKKLARLGSYAGKLATPIDEKYAAYYFRYPELYLLKAELLARTGAPISQAIAPINEMRAKRISPVLPALNPATQAELMDLIFKEIFIELSLENGSEFFASIRFQKDGKPWITTIKDGKALEINKVCWPIPDAEMINNTLMVQNPDLK